MRERCVHCGDDLPDGSQDFMCERCLGEMNALQTLSAFVDEIQPSDFESVAIAVAGVAITIAAGVALGIIVSGAIG